MHYRPEIDGLRAVAVVPVILFHAGFHWFSGGYVGVDVFFVISGYLITGLILTEMADGRFSLINFYERRARRILPALFLILAACLPFAYLLLMPRDLKDFGQSLIAVSTFSSNILFWRESGYFEVNSELKPLLHTWSLAVEEQYYIIFPLLLMLLWRFGKHSIHVSLMILFTASLGLAHWGAYYKPDATYYFLPTRAWELLLGSFAAIFINNKSQFLYRGNEFFVLFGLLLITYAIFFFDESTPYPSIYTLVPTFGTFLIIAFAKKGIFSQYLLSNRAFVSLGLISYSAYLWHLPLIVFSKHFYLGSIPLNITIITIILTFALSLLTYKFVETPVRINKKYFSRAKIFRLSVVLSSIFIIIGIFIHKSEGWAGRIHGKPDVAEFIKYFENDLPDWQYYEREKIIEHLRTDCGFFNIARYRSGHPTAKPVEKITSNCYERDVSYQNAVLLWGDSHAQMLRYGLDKNLTGNWQILQVASSGCAPSIVTADDENHYCHRSNWYALQTIQAQNPDVVLIGQAAEHSLEKMKKINSHLRNLGVDKVIFTGPAPSWNYELPLIIAVRLWHQTPRHTWLGVRKSIIERDQFLSANAAASGDFEYVSLVDYFCNEDGCATYVGKDKYKGITSWDQSHINLMASDYFVRDVLKDVITENK